MCQEQITILICALNRILLEIHLELEPFHWVCFSGLSGVPLTSAVNPGPLVDILIFLEGLCYQETDQFCLYMGLSVVNIKFCKSP